jgi:FkbM family methyltransferase
MLEEIRSQNLSEAIYVDVGANHPSRISNTYLLYREGLRGVIVEPNPELLALHRRFRPRDIAVGVGCGERPNVAKFHVHSAPVTSSFLESAASERGAKIVRAEYVPIMPLDTILDSIEFENVSLLSVDTEGLDAEVLSGATETLRHTFMVCVEVNTDQIETAIVNLLTPSFELVQRFECNMIWRNRNWDHARRQARRRLQ